MSVRGLLYAARDILREEMSLDAFQIDVKFDARPPFSGPDLFIGIWSGQWEPGENIGMEQGLDELCGATFTITRATGVCPPDRLDEELIYAMCTGVEYQARRIMHILTRRRWDWICLANEFAMQEVCECDPVPPVEVFTCPPRWAGNDPTPRIVGPDWLSADPGEEEGDFAVVMDVRFRDAKRIQDIGNL